MFIFALTQYLKQQLTFAMDDDNNPMNNLSGLFLQM